VLKKKISVARAITQLDRAHIIHLFHVAKRIHKAQGLEIRCAPKKLGHSKILIVTPRACGSAVERNLIKRRIKSIFYQEKLFERPYDCIVFVYPQAHALSFEELTQLFINTIPCS
jgi:ribonuclease P protein component